MSAGARKKRPVPRKADMERVYEFAEKHQLKICGLRVHPDGGFTFDFGDRPANDDDIDRELAELEARHGQG